MVIELLNSNDKYVTVRFNYDEVRDLSNSTFHASLKDDKFKTIHGKCLMLFYLVKEGFIPDFELNEICKIFSKNTTN